MVGCTRNPSTLEAEVGVFQVWGQAGLRGRASPQTANHMSLIVQRDCPLPGSADRNWQQTVKQFWSDGTQPGPLFVVNVHCEVLCVTWPFWSCTCPFERRERFKGEWQDSCRLYTALCFLLLCSPGEKQVLCLRTCAVCWRSCIKVAQLSMSGVREHHFRAKC